MGFSIDTGFDTQRNGAEALWPPAFGAAIFDFDGTLAATEGLWEEVDRIFFGQRGIEYDALAHQTLATLGFAAGAEWVRQTYGLDEPTADICDEWNRLGHALYETRVELRPGARVPGRAEAGRRPDCAGHDQRPVRALRNGAAR